MMIVTGGMGRLGRALQACLPEAAFLSHADLDVTDDSQCARYFERHSVTTIVHLAAYTLARGSQECYVRQNIVGTARMATWAIRLGARLIYTSTDYVYPGDRGHYHESDPVLPIGPYAWSKLAGEAAVPDTGVVIRGSWYEHLSHPSAPTDSYTSKASTTFIAPIIAALVRSSFTGIVNVGGERRSLYDVVRETNPAVLPTTRAALTGGPYQLPADISLDLTRLRQFLRETDLCAG